MIIKNEYLGYSLIFVLVLSIVSAAGALGYLYYINQHGPLPIGKASSDDGYTYVNINSFLSITLDDDTINFFGCRPGVTIYSNTPFGDGVNACDGYINDGILLRNDGTLYANVTMNFSNWGKADGGTFLDTISNTSWLAYGVVNSSRLAQFEGGCMGTLPIGFTRINTSDKYPVCDKLKPHLSDNSVTINIGIRIPSDVVSGVTGVTMQFFATQSQ